MIIGLFANRSMKLPGLMEITITLCRPKDGDVGANDRKEMDWRLVLACTLKWLRPEYPYLIADRIDPPFVVLSRDT